MITTEFPPYSFANKGIDAINISNILNRKEVVKEIPPYIKNQFVPIVSHSYTNSIDHKLFNYKEALQDINIEEYLKNPLTCDCSHSPFQYNPSGHVITGDLNIIQHESLRKVFLMVLNSENLNTSIGNIISR
jgi:hypothetical protein